MGKEGSVGAGVGIRGKAVVLSMAFGDQEADLGVKVSVR